MFSVKFSSKYNSANGKNSLFRITELYVNNGIIHVQCNWIQKNDMILQSSE